MMNLKKALLILAVICLLLPSAGPAQAKKDYFMGTGSLGGLYYPAGGMIAKLYNGKYADRIKIESTEGSVENLKRLMEGDLDLALIQGDVAYMAYKGKLDFQKGKPYKDLRALLGLHVEAMTIVASEKSGITSMANMRGKRVALGEPGSGSLKNSEVALKAAGLTKKDLKQALTIGHQKAMDLFKKGKLDAIFLTVGHPNDYVKRLSTLKGTKITLVSVPNVVSNILVNYPYFTIDYISTFYYRKAMNKVGVETFGPKALLLTTKAAPAPFIKDVMDAVYDNFSVLCEKIDAFKRLTPDKTVKGVTVPFHPAAKDILKMRGLLKK
jgi:TRAP transporter TAXI family solute receptor